MAVKLHTVYTVARCWKATNEIAEAVTGLHSEHTMAAIAEAFEQHPEVRLGRQDVFVWHSRTRF